MVKIQALYEKHGSIVKIEVMRPLIFGLFKRKVTLCYLWIDRNEDRQEWVVTKSSDRNYHSTYTFRATAATYDNHGARKEGPGVMTGAWETAISMWPVYKEKRAVEIYEEINKLIDFAYENTL